MAWQFVYFQSQLAESDCDFDNCPTFCHLKKKQKFRLCDDCHLKQLQDSFKENCQKFLNERVKDWKQHFSLDSLISQVSQIANFDEQSEMLWITDKCQQIYESEKLKKRRVDDYNEKQARKNQS